ncbi:hypothetical protein AUP74_01980 [Microbulbifer aggregans]|uniref:DUF3108 domain-containing protein n=1 Tax=Microbulbifer aggregans TaxID=1769779 RepID=A0A1C9W8E7_9GAMM|nr:DUF3108 domain-containing protein [Microbulbifer aggregans]AOS97410.1 hypothetical protein AUP74_01980 [Microbulbifer aggregans]
MPFRRLATLVSIFATLLLTPLVSATELKPFRAVYEARYGSFEVTATRSLSGKAGNWRLDFQADSFFADINEYSRFLKQNGQLSPLHYEYRRTGLGRNRHTSLNFEPGEKRVVNLTNTDRTLENAPEKIQDKISYQLQLALDVAAGKKDLQYVVTDGKKLREYRFKIAGKETLKTPLGEVETVKVQRVREDDDRETNIWFAPGWNYALVKLQQEEDGETYQIALTELIIDGKSINTP